VLPFHVYHIILEKIGHCSTIPAAGCRPLHESMIEALFLCMRLREYPPKNMVRKLKTLTAESERERERESEREVHKQTVFRVFSGVMITREPCIGMEQ
jgi:hypothetical protein